MASPTRGLCPLDPRRRAAAVISAARREFSVQFLQDHGSGQFLSVHASFGTNKMGSGAVVRSTRSRDGPSGASVEPLALTFHIESSIFFFIT